MQKNEHAAALGRMTSDKKAASSRENGRKGGRPRGKFELAYFGAAMDEKNRPIRYKRRHATIESARAEHQRIAHRLMGCCNGVVYGPGCGSNGMPA